MASLVAPKTGDGRVARGERTRRALAEALIALLEEGDAQPTARRIAERAGVSLRLVFHHFDDLESILRDAVRIQEQRHWRHVRPVESTLPVRRAGGPDGAPARPRCSEATAPVRRSAELLTHSSPTVAAELARGREWLRSPAPDDLRPRARGQTPRPRPGSCSTRSRWRRRGRPGTSSSASVARRPPADGPWRHSPVPHCPSPPTRGRP